MQMNLAERIRTVLNSGPFGLDVSHTGIYGHEAIYKIVCYQHGMPSCEWAMETEDGTAVIEDVLRDLGYGELPCAVFQAEIYRALLLELESVLSESAAVIYGNAGSVTNETLMKLIQYSVERGK